MAGSGGPASTRSLFPPLHPPDPIPVPPRYADGALYLCELQAEGAVRHVGATNFDVPRMEVMERAGVRFASNQVRPAAQAASRVCKALKETCRVWEVQVEGRSKWKPGSGDIRLLLRGTTSVRAVPDSDAAVYDVVLRLQLTKLCCPA